MTLEAAEKLPMRNGRSARQTSAVSSSARSMPPSRSSPMVTTSAIDSRQGSSLEWCSYGPTNTTGRSLGGMRSSSRPRPAGRNPSRPTSLSTAPVAPDPQKMTRSCSPPPTAWWISRRASSRSRVVCQPVPELSVWVLA